jgi:hypothetical protein
LRTWILGLVLLCLLSPVWAQGQKPVMVSDKFYWDGAECNLGINLSGKFSSLTKMAEIFKLTQVIGDFNNKQWVLNDILVAVDFNANGFCAGWQVSGPKPLLLEYLKNLKAHYKDKSIFYDFSYGFINFKPTAYFETEVGISSKQALKIAEDICKKEGWKWAGVHIQDKDEYYEINTNWHALGSNAYFKIDKRTGKVLAKYITGP